MLLSFSFLYIIYNPLKHVLHHHSYNLFSFYRFYRLDIEWLLPLFIAACTCFITSPRTFPWSVLLSTFLTFAIYTITSHIYFFLLFPLRFLAAAALRPFSGCNLLCWALDTFLRLPFLAVLAV